jgi:ribose transport system substrate-binding protein
MPRDRYIVKSLVHASEILGAFESAGDVLRLRDVIQRTGFRTSLEKVRRHLRESKARRILVGAANDPSALGAARAFQEASRDAHCAIVGQNAEPDARAELRDPRTLLVASVAYFPERYGDDLIRLALDILARRPVLPAVFVHHQVITADNVDHFYPNDALLRVAALTAHV